MDGLVELARKQHVAICCNTGAAWCFLQDYDPRWKEAFKLITDGAFGDVEYFDDLVASVNDVPARGNDWFLVANDFTDYMRAQVQHAPPCTFTAAALFGKTVSGWLRHVAHGWSLGNSPLTCCL